MNSKRTPMPIEERAKQFSAFAALSGLGMAYRKKEEEVEAAIPKGDLETVKYEEYEIETNENKEIDFDEKFCNN